MCTLLSLPLLIKIPALAVAGWLLARSLFKTISLSAILSSWVLIVVVVPLTCKFPVITTFWLKVASASTLAKIVLFNPSKVSASPTVSLFHDTSLPLTVAIFINVLDESNQRSPVEISLTLLGTSDVPYILAVSYTHLTLPTTPYV